MEVFADIAVGDTSIRKAHEKKCLDAIEASFSQVSWGADADVMLMCYSRSSYVLPTI